MIQLEAKRLAENLCFPEGPRWHAGKLWVSDILGRRVVTVGMDGEVTEFLHVPNMPSGSGWLPDGRMLLVSMFDSSVWIVQNGESQLYADLASMASGPLNDMVVDGQGRAYVGASHIGYLTGQDPQTSEVLILIPDQEPRVVARDMVFPNGMVITPDGSTLIVAETFACRLTAFAIDLETGELSDRQILADLGELTPDGICLDVDGGVWVACMEGNQFVRVLEGGEITHEVSAEGWNATACMLGGSDGASLFVLSTEPGSQEERMQGKASGRVSLVSAPSAAAGWPSSD